MPAAGLRHHAVQIGEIPVGPGVPDPGFWPWIRVFGPTGGTVVCGNCWGNETAQMSTTAPLTGTYTVVVASASVTQEGTGDYTLRSPAPLAFPTDGPGRRLQHGVQYALGPAHSWRPDQRQQ